MSRLQKKPSAHKRGHPTLQNMNFFYFCGSFLPSWIRIRIQITDPDPMVRLNTDPIRIRIPDPDPDPQHCRIRISITSIGVKKRGSWIHIRNTISDTTKLCRGSVSGSSQIRITDPDDIHGMQIRIQPIRNCFQFHENEDVDKLEFSIKISICCPKY